jgi:hypothetical protein
LLQRPFLTDRGAIRGGPRSRWKRRHLTIGASLG